MSYDEGTEAAFSPTTWFYLALAAFGLTALALVALIMVAAFKLRRNQRHVAHDRHHRNSRISVGSAGAETNISLFSAPSSLLGIRDHAM
ncbi:hypothetical protein ACOMHN_053680 [Nucella lapillus]